MKGLNAVAPLLSVSVTVQSSLPVHVGLVSTTRGCRVIDVSELTVTLSVQLLLPRFQLALPVSAPLQEKDTFVTLLKLAPAAASVAS